MAADINNTVLQGGSFIGGEDGSGRKVGRAQAGEWWLCWWEGVPGENKPFSFDRVSLSLAEALSH